jgi:ABC-2 type transport system permease protein
VSVSHASHAHHALGRASALAGAGALTRLALRRDRVRIVAWAVGLTGLFVLTASAWEQLYPTVEERAALGATLASTPALTALLGPVFDPLSIGGLTAWRLGSGVAVILALVNGFLVVRHSRSEEQDGRGELVLSGRVARAAPLLAGLLSALLLDAVLVVLVMVVLGPWVGWAGSAVLILAVAGCALVFAGVAGLMAQVARTSRAANGLTGLVIAATFIAAAAANAGSANPGGPLLWLSPFGWVQQARAFAGDRWAVVALAYVTAMVLAACALVGASWRDLGRGLLGVRPGPSRAAGWIGGPFSTVWRLDRVSIAAWAAGAAAFGLMIGFLITAAVDLVEGSPQLAELFERFGGEAAIADSYVAQMSSVLALAGGAFGVNAMLRLRADESAGRLDLAFPTRSPRWQWLAARATSAGLGAALIAIAGTAAMGLTYALSTQGENSPTVLGAVGRFIGGGAIAVPAAWCLIAFAALLVGAVPGYAWAAWAGVVWVGVVVQLGPLLDLPAWVQRTSPFWYLPTWPIGDFRAAPLIGLVLVAVVGIAAGAVGLNRRDVPSVS